MISTSSCNFVNKIGGNLTRIINPIENVLGMKYSVIMERHEGAPLDRGEIHDSVLPLLVHCVVYCEHRSKLALPTHSERKSLILFFHPR